MSKDGSLIGTIVGNYEIQRELGRGGMGVVYKAHEMSLQRVVALKILPAHLAENDEFVARFEREARAAARLTHPNIVTVYAVGEHAGMHFMAMEYVKGKTIAMQITEQGRFEVGRALDITLQAAEALAEAHEKDIVHRDIKPQNIMCDQVGRVKVMDFGLAKVLGGASALTATGTAMGTPAYMSPEQCKGEAVDLRTDIYSLGVMLFEMLTGRPPYVGDTPMAVMSQIALSDFPAVRDLNPDVPLGVAFIVKKMVAKNLANRYNSAQALEADIERWLREGDSQLPIEEAVTVRASEEATRLVTPEEGVPVEAASAQGKTPEAPSAVRDTGKRRGPLLLVAAALCLLAIGGTGVFLAFRLGQTRAGAPTTSDNAPPQVASVSTETTERDAATPPQATAVPQASEVDGDETPGARPEEPPAADVVAEGPKTDGATADAENEGTQGETTSPQASAAAEAPEGVEASATSQATEAAAIAVAAEPKGNAADSTTAPEEKEAVVSEAPPAAASPQEPEQKAADKAPKTAAGPTEGKPAETTAVKIAEAKAQTPAPAGPKEYAGGRLVDRGDGTVFDNDTMLIWQKGDSGKTYGLPRPGRTTDYRHYADGLELAGRSSWRIPTKGELMTLPTDDFSPKELPFVNSGNGFYWCYGTGPNRFYWIYDWNKAKFGVTTPDANEKFAIRCVTGP